MAATGPIIEELPDDYEEELPTASASSGAFNSGAGGKSSAKNPRPQAADSRGAGLRKGFFNRPAAVSSTCDAASVQAKASEAPLASSEASRPQASVPSSSSSQGIRTEDSEIADLVDTLKMKLQSRVALASEQNALSGGTREALDELREALTSPAASASRWPTPQARSGMSKASQEANSALAEMRSASNDARRMRSGDEKKVMAELRRVSDEVADRLRKVVDLSAPKPTPDEEKSAASVAAFHALPFTAKLRLLADDRIALGLLGASFFAGMALVFGILVEVYSAWGCGYRCGAA